MRGGRYRRPPRISISKRKNDSRHVGHSFRKWLFPACHISSFRLQDTICYYEIMDRTGAKPFEGFHDSMIDTGEAIIHVRHGGTGAPLLLLHGVPETHLMWHKVAPRLAQHFAVVATDLRGYGESSTPQNTPDHAPYTKRAMARDQVAVMQQLGYDRFTVAGHDRGARVAYRMALDYPESVEKLALLEPVW